MSIWGTISDWSGNGAALILTFCASATFTSLLLTYVFSEKYKAYTTVLYRPQTAVTFRPKTQAALGFPPPLVPLETIGNTVEQVAKSDAALEQIVRTLALDQERPRPPESLFGYLFRTTKDTAKEWGGKAWQILKHGRIIEKDSFAGAMADLNKNLTVKRGTKTYTFRLEVVDKSPQLAAIIVDTAAEVLSGSLREENTRAASQERERIAVRLAESEQELRDIRTELEQFKGAQDVASHGEEVSMRLSMIGQFEEGLALVDNELQSMIRRYTELTAQLESQEPSIKYSSTTEENPVVEEMRMERADKEVTRSALLETFTEIHPQIKTIDAELASIERRLGERMRRW